MKSGWKINQHLVERAGAGLGLPRWVGGRLGRFSVCPASPLYVAQRGARLGFAFRLTVADADPASSACPAPLAHVARIGGTLKTLQIQV